MKEKIEDYFDKVSSNFIQLKNQSQKIENAANEVMNSLKKGNKIIFCGNGVLQVIRNILQQN